MCISCGPKVVPSVRLVLTIILAKACREPAHGRGIAGHSLPVTLIGLTATTGLDILLKPDW